jgi:hypothetical protein
MSQDTIGSWLEKAKSSQSDESSSDSRIKVIRREEPVSKGNMIMAIAEKIRPHLMSFFDGVRDDEGILLQPAHIRGMALNMAQGLLRRHELNIKSENK